MTLRIAINGFGRIGRCIVRALHGRADLRDQLEIVAINDLGELDALAHLLRYDSVHRTFAASVEVSDGGLVVDGRPIRVTGEPDPSALPWRDVGVDVVMECTGRFVRREDAAKHLDAGAGRVVISAPAKGDVPTFVYGVNHGGYDSERDAIVSNGSCTTNCLAPIAKVLDDAFGIERGLMTTIHSYTNDQHTLDLPHRKGDLRRARAAAVNMIPTSTGAASAVAQVLPQLAGKFDGLAVRVPTMDVSLVDLAVVTREALDVDVVDAAMREAASGALAGVLAVAEAPLVSSDYIGHPASSIYDPELTRVSGDRFVKVFAWYDNEWGFSNRMLDLAAHMARG